METVAWNKLRNLFKTGATISGVECVLPLTCRKIIRLQSLITNVPFSPALKCKAKQ